MINYCLEDVMFPMLLCSSSLLFHGVNKAQGQTLRDTQFPLPVIRQESCSQNHHQRKRLSTSVSHLLLDWMSDDEATDSPGSLPCVL